MSDFRKQSSYKLYSYEPNDVDIRQQTIPVQSVLDMMDHREIELWRPNDFQRLSGLWSARDKSRLIESLLMRIPLPIFYFDGSQFPWKIIDGLQRLTILDDFINKNAFRLTDLEYLSEIDGLTFEELPFQFRRTIKNFNIEAYVINPGTPQNVKFNIFQRINTAGVRLNAQELRNSYFSGPAVEFINDLAGLEEFQKAIGPNISKKRMKDKVFALRFVAFFTNSLDYSPPMDAFLDETMMYIKEFSVEKKAEIIEKFSKAIKTSVEIFGDDVFRIINLNGHRLTNMPNICLFEAWTVNLAILDSKKHQKLILNKDFLIKGFAEYMQIKDFYRAITSATTSNKSVDLRFSMISDLIENSI